MADVVDSNHQGPTGAGALVGDQVERAVDVDRGAGGELWDLRVTASVQDLPHLVKNFREGQVLLSLLLVGVQDIQENRRAGTSGTTGRVRKLEASNVAHVGRSLRVLAARDHHDGRSAKDLLLAVLEATTDLV